MQENKESDAYICAAYNKYLLILLSLRSQSQVNVRASTVRLGLTVLILFATDRSSIDYPCIDVYGPCPAYAITTSRQRPLRPRHHTLTKRVHAKSIIR